MEAADGGVVELAAGVRHLDVHGVVVAGQVHEAGEAGERPAVLVPPAAGERAAVRAVGAGLPAGRAAGVRLGGGDQVHHPAHRVGGQPERHHAPVDLHLLDQVHRDVGDPEGISSHVQRNAVEEVADLVVLQAVDREACGRAEPAGAPQRDALGLGQHLAQIAGPVVRLVQLQHRDRVGRAPELFGRGGPAAHRDLDRRRAVRLPAGGGWRRGRSGRDLLRGGRREAERLAQQDAGGHRALPDPGWLEAVVPGGVQGRLVEAMPSPLDHLGGGHRAGGVEGQPEHHLSLEPGGAGLLGILDRRPLQQARRDPGRGRQALGGGGVRGGGPGGGRCVVGGAGGPGGGQRGGQRHRQGERERARRAHRTFMSLKAQPSTSKRCVAVPVASIS
ncbi:MAG: hypothetical protein QM767_03880 [Anaeromyxobacter sp.]